MPVTQEQIKDQQKLVAQKRVAAAIANNAVQAEQGKLVELQAQAQLEALEG